MKRNRNTNRIHRTVKLNIKFNGKMPFECWNWWLIDFTSLHHFTSFMAHGTSFSYALCLTFAKVKCSLNKRVMFIQVVLSTFALCGWYPWKEFPFVHLHHFQQLIFKFKQILLPVTKFVVWQGCIVVFHSIEISLRKHIIL